MGGTKFAADLARMMETVRKRGKTTPMFGVVGVRVGLC